MSPTPCRPFRVTHVLPWITAVATGLSLVARAELPGARLETLFPPGAKAGTTVELTASGADLDDGETLLFSSPGFHARILPAQPNRVQVVVSNQVPRGVYEARWVGRFGVSNPRLFVVGDLPEVLGSTNQSRESAMRLPLGSTANGKIAASRSDYYRFAAKQGQHITVECAATDLDSKLEPSLWLFDSNGRELSRSRRNGVIRFTSVRDGDYIVRVHDFLNRGGDAYFYRLTVSTRPQVLYTSPGAALPGTNRAFTLFGWNLPGSKPGKDLALDGKAIETLQVSLRVPGDELGATPLSAALPIRAPAGGLDMFPYTYSGKNGSAQPTALSVSTVPVLVETEPNSLPAQAQKISVPAEIDGWFQGRQDRDWVEFDGRKGQAFIVEVVSQRLGAITDPALVIQKVSKDAAGKEQVSDVQEVYDNDTNIGGVDFKTSSGDPNLRLEVKEDARYRILVRDQSTAPNELQLRPYRLIIRPPTPDFRLTVSPATPPQANKDAKDIKIRTPILRSGGTLAYRVTAFRKDGFDAPIDLNVEGLPTGVQFQGARMAGDATTALVILTAGDGLTNWQGSIRVTGRAQTPQGERRREGRPATLIWPTPNYETELPQTRFSEQLSLATRSAEVEPLRLTLGAGKAIEAVPGSKLSIPLLVQRKGEFGANLKLRLLGHGLFGAGKEIDLDKQATQAVFEVNLGEIKLPEGQHWLHAETTTSFQTPRSVQALATAEADKANAEKQIPVLKDALDKAKAALEAATKALEKAESDAKAAPDKPSTVAPARDAKTAAAKLVEESTRKVDANNQLKAKAEERIKAFAKREFSESFYSSPVLVKIAPTKPK